MRSSKKSSSGPGTMDGSKVYGRWLGPLLDPTTVDGSEIPKNHPGMVPKP